MKNMCQDILLFCIKNSALYDKMPRLIVCYELKVEFKKDL